MTRLRTNLQIGNISDAPLVIGAGTVNSAAFANLPVVAAPDIMTITLDPGRWYGAPEILWVTGHTAGSTAVTVLRGQEGSTARQHTQGEQWVHGATAGDHWGSGQTWYGDQQINGRLGLGIAPAVPVHIGGITSWSNSVRIEGSGVSGVGIELRDNDVGGHTYALFSSGSANSPGAGTFAIWDENAPAGTGSGYRFSIDRNGWVGIGDYTPASRLSVAGRMSQSGSADTTGEPITGYLMTNNGQQASTTALNPGVLVFGGDATNAVYGVDLGYINGAFAQRYFSGGSGNQHSWGYHGAGVGANVPDQSAYVEVMRLTNAGVLSILRPGYLDLTASGATSVGAATVLGDKIALWGSSFGFGVQSSRIVAFINPTGYFAVRPVASSGQKSSGTDAVTLGTDGTVTGTNSLQGTQLRAIGPGGVPRWYLKSTDSAADAKVWDAYAFGNQMIYRLLNDAETASTTYLTVGRSGYALTAITFQGAVQFNGGGINNIEMNADRSQRSTQMKWNTKDNADSGGAMWVMYADADAAVVGADQWSLWGYPRDTAGTTLGNERFITAGFLGGKAAGYTKFVTVTVSGSAPPNTAGALTVSGKIMSTGTGTPAGAGLTPGSVQHYDNDNHFWESDGIGGWIFRNTWNSTNARIRFMCGVGAPEVLTLGSDGITMKPPVWNYVGASGQPAFQNAWVNFVGSPPYESARFCKDAEGFVRVEGLVTGGTWTGGLVVFTLPAGYRPPKRHIFLVDCSAPGGGSSGDIGIARIDLRETGEIVVIAAFGFDNTTVKGTSNAWLSLDGIQFSVNA